MTALIAVLPSPAGRGDATLIRPTTSATFSPREKGLAAAL